MKIDLKALNRPLFGNRKLNSAVFAVLIIVFIFQMSLVAINPLRNLVYVEAERIWQSGWFHGSRGLPWQIASRFMFSPTIPVWVEVEPDISMFLDPNDLVQATIMTTGAWEPETWDSMSKYLTKGGVFVDVGAYIGYHSLKAAKIVGPQGRVLAIEPNPDTLPVLRKNVSANHGDIVSIVPVACSDTETTLEFFSASGSNSGASSISKANAEHFGAVRASYQIPARPLDTIIRENNLSRVDVIKIDVEGAEFLVLKGAEETLDHFHPVVFMEFMESQLNNMSTTKMEIIEWLQARGYTEQKEFSDENDNSVFVYTSQMTSHKPQHPSLNLARQPFSKNH